MFSFRNLFSKLKVRMNKVIQPPVPANDAERIYALTRVYENTCISIGDFTEFLKPEWAYKMDPTTDRSVLGTGLYCTIHGKKLWVSRIVGPGHVRVTNETILHATKDEAIWSPEFPIMFYDKIERALKIKAFW